jgi:hypothetical protein
MSPATTTRKTANPPCVLSRLRILPAWTRSRPLPRVCQSLRSFGPRQLSDQSRTYETEASVRGCRGACIDSRRDRVVLHPGVFATPFLHGGDCRSPRSHGLVLWDPTARQATLDSHQPACDGAIHRHGDSDFSAALKIHADVALEYFGIIFLVNLLILPFAIVVFASIRRLRGALYYLGVYAVAISVGIGTMLLAHGQFLIWWWD